MSYAVPQDLLDRYDNRILGDVCSDTGVRVTSTQLLSNGNVQAALDDAAGAVNLACQVGERYTQAQLAGLSGTDKAILVRLCCDLAFIYLCERRGVKPPIYDETYKRSDEILQRLKDGAAIFNVAGDVASGVAAQQFPTAQNYVTVDTLRTATINYFPTRRQQQVTQ